MWESGVLGDSNPRQLSDTLFFLLGIHLALRGEEQKALRRPGHNPQIVKGVDEDSFECLYTQDPKSKSNQRSLSVKYFPSKVVYKYRYRVNPSRSIVSYFERYCLKLPINGKTSELYLQPRRKPSPTQWYEDRCIGINKLRTTVKRLCKLAGIPGNNFRYTLFIPL